MRRILPAVLYIAFSLPSYAQFLPDLQAKTPEEYDAYLDVLDGPVLEKGAVFERRFPESSLRLPVCELMARAWRAQGDVGHAVAAAEKGVAIAPDYVPLLVELADLLSNGSRKLERAEGAARRALELLQTAKAPRRVSAEEWVAAVSTLRARAHDALGVVRFKRGDAAGARKEFEAALVVETSENAAVHYRLGRLLAATGEKAAARRHLEEAAKRGDGKLRELALGALAELQ